MVAGAMAGALEGKVAEWDAGALGAAVSPVDMVAFTAALTAAAAKCGAGAYTRSLFSST